MINIPCVRVKDGVRLDPVTPTHAHLLWALDSAARIHGVDLTVTCGREGHDQGDPHTRGAALDVRVSDLSPEKVLAVYKYIASTLGADFTVLYEAPNRPLDPQLAKIVYVNASATAAHLHLQPRKFTVYPPQDTLLSIGSDAKQA